MPGPGNNLHRVVIFRDGADRAKQVLPFSAYDSENPEDLWKYMATYEQKTGGRMLAITHNGNLSNGRMFELKKFDGSPLDRAYAQTRIQREPLAEMTQAKGTGESHPFLSPDDAGPTSRRKATSAACRWAATWPMPRRARRRH